MPNNTVITKEGLEKLKKELEDLKLRGRKEVIDRIRTAKEFGDLSENAEYEDAKNQQSFIEGRIQELEETIKRAKIVGDNRDISKVDFGDTIEINCDGDKSTYTIVGTTESNPHEGKISIESPIAKALMGKKVGDVVDVPTPDGGMKCEILKIS
jgi:transcription elongation factor GreA